MSSKTPKNEHVSSTCSSNDKTTEERVEEIVKSLNPQNFIEYMEAVDDECVNEDKWAEALHQALKATREEAVREERKQFKPAIITSLNLLTSEQMTAEVEIPQADIEIFYKALTEVNNDNE